MFDPKAMLDALIGAASRSSQETPGHGSSGQGGGRVDAGGTTPAGAIPGAAPADGIVATARDIMAQNPTLTEAAFLGLVGLMFGKRKGGISGKLGRLGGLAVIGGLAFKAYQTWRAPSSAGIPAPRSGLLSPNVLNVPEDSHFHPVSQTEDDALLYLRAMVAAAAADGQVDADERARIVKGMNAAGIDPDSTRWLEEELASPADVEELAAPVNTPEKAAQVYAAARIAIDPDTMQEREFLRQLALLLDLDDAYRARIEETLEDLH
jgi:uncharacterized membrane protein YebE (DUF533 family)